MSTSCKERKPRDTGKGYEDPCIICGENRFTEDAHFPKPAAKEGRETMFLCRTHHRLLDTGRLSRLDFEALWRSCHPDDFASVEEFVEWAYDSCYAYSLSDLLRKFWFDEQPQLLRRLAAEEIISSNRWNMLCCVDFGDSMFTVGAPHHAPGGTDSLPFGKESDENVGFLALDLAKLLQGRCVVASNYGYDPNKCKGDYLYYITQRHPRVFIEVHGHGGTKSENDIEISCGTKDMTDVSERLRRTIEDIIRSRSLKWVADEIWETLRGTRVSGVFSDLRYRATETHSVSHIRKTGGTPYHIEISPGFRKNERDSVPKEGKVLMEVIAEALKRQSST